MEIHNLNKDYVRSLFSLYNIQDQKANCVIETFANIKLAIIDNHNDYKVAISKFLHEKPTSFYVIIRRTKTTQKLIDGLLKERLSGIMAVGLRNFLLYSFYAYVIYLNKGIQVRLFTHDKIKAYLIKFFVTFTLYILKQSYVTIKDIGDLVLLTTVYVGMCFFGVQSSEDLSLFMKNLQLGLYDKFKLKLFFNKIKDLCVESGLTYPHILVDYFELKTLNPNLFVMNALRMLGVELATLFLKCDRYKSGEQRLIMSLSMGQLYYYFESGEFNTANVAKLNRLSENSITYLHKALKETLEIGHIERC